MKKYLCCLLVLGALSVSAAKAPLPLVYNGDTLPQTNIFKRTTCGWLKPGPIIPEISGIACSRVTPGYIWMQSDDYEDCIVATTELAQRRSMLVNFSKKIRWDWEDMSGGVYEGKNYLFIGAFGDNEETDGEYSIVWFEEPEITPSSPTITVTPSQIRFSYPDGKNNAEALMYDNVEQMIYIITKKYYQPCKVYKLPFRLDYGNEIQTLEEVCSLGIQSDLGDGSRPYKGFHLVTAADISPDGKYVLIKNHNNIVADYSWILYWEREGNESIAETIKRQPVVLDCYEYEWQGEAMCWLDSATFYTTSDSEGEPPVYKYTRRSSQGIGSVQTEDYRTTGNTLVVIDNVLYIRTKEGLYTLDGRKSNRQ